MTVPDHMSKPFKKPLASTEVSTHGMVRDFAFITKSSNVAVSRGQTRAMERYG